MFIMGLNKTTLLDYPEHVACTIFTGGCNLRCPFCHNSDLIIPTEAASSQAISEEEILSFLRKRKGILTGVCITGGEPTLQPDLADFIRQIKELGLLVKLDTNGFRPQVLISLLEENLLDYVAVDIKNAPEKYALTAGLQHADLSLLQTSIDALIDRRDTLSFEFRTTVVEELHTLADITAIAKWIQKAPAYYLQAFKDSEQVLTTGFHTPSMETMLSYLQACKAYLPNTVLRGIDA